MSLPELREKHFGTWEGLTDREVLERFPDAHATGWGDGESSDEMAARIVQVVERIVEAHQGELVLVVTHGGPMRAILRHYDGETAPIPNCGVVRLEARDGVVHRVH